MTSRGGDAAVLDMDRKTEWYFGHERPEMLPFVPGEARRVLDVGCGRGRFGAQLKARGAEVWGLELDPEAAAEAAERLDRVLVGDVQRLVDELPARTFDVAVCNDVLEHLADPYSVLAALKGKLAPGGVVVASIPNVRWLPNVFNLLLRKDWRYEDEGVMDKTHLRFFTQKSMRAMFVDLGYDVVRMQGINPMAGWKPRVFDALTLGRHRDMRWQQFAIVARPR